MSDSQDTADTKREDGPVSVPVPAEAKTLKALDVMREAAGSKLTQFLEYHPEHRAAVLQVIDEQREHWESAMAAHIQADIDDLLDDPTLRFMKAMFENRPANLSALEVFGHFLNVIRNYKSLFNTFDEDLRGNAEGGIEKTVMKVPVVATDIRKFTEFTHLFQSDASDYMRLGYFTLILPIIQQYHMKIIDNEGDALMLYCHDQKDATGKIILSSVENAVLFSLELNRETNNIARRFRERLNFGEPTSVHFNSGIGIAYGSLSLLDAFDENPLIRGVMATVRSDIQNRMAAENPDLLQKLERKIMLIVLGEVLNEAARLQALDKNEEGKADPEQHNIFISNRAMMHVDENLRKDFVSYGSHLLKGLDDRRVFASMRHPQSQIIAVGDS